MGVEWKEEFGFLGLLSENIFYCPGERTITSLDELPLEWGNSLAPQLGLDVRDFSDWAKIALLPKFWTTCIGVKRPVN